MSETQLRPDGPGPEKTHDQMTSPVADDAAVAKDVHLSREFVDKLLEAVRAEDAAGARQICDDLHAADMADLLQVLPARERRKLLNLIQSDIDPELFHEIEGEARGDLYEITPNTQIADAVTELETDEAVYVLEDLRDEDREEVLRALSADDRVAIEESLSYPEDSAGRLMQRDLIALPEFWTVGQTIDLLRSDDADIPDDFYDIFVVDPAHKPVGTVPLSRVMRNQRSVSLGHIMEKKPHVIEAAADQEEVAYAFTKYHLISAAVVDESQRLVGVVTVDDIVEVIEEEAQEDILALAGVGESASVNESLFEVTRGRFTWLLVNLATAVLASVVIGLFDAAIEQMVALAVLMPIVASMGGNAGTQTMTVAVRGLATKELSATNAARILNRELMIALGNGVLLAVISGLLAWLWFGSPGLGGVFAAAMIFNLLVAGIFGLLVPMGLARVGIDPAIASSVFVTTITDVIGFFVFLGLAALWLF